MKSLLLAASIFAFAATAQAAETKIPSGQIASGEAVVAKPARKTVTVNEDFILETSKRHQQSGGASALDLKDNGRLRGIVTDGALSPSAGGAADEETVKY